MAVSERVDLSIIQENDLDESSARSGFYQAINDQGELETHLLVRPDNFCAIQYLEKNGFSVGKDLWQDRFLLEAKLLIDQSPIYPKPPEEKIKLPYLVEDFLSIVLAR